MKKILLFSLCLFAIVFFWHSPQSVWAETLEVNPIADSFVNDGASKQDDNYGGSTLTVSYDSVTRRALVRFDLTTLPEEAQIDSAILKLYLFEKSGDPSAAIRASELLGDWSENEVNWNNQPSFNESGGVISNIDETYEYKSWDITNIVRGWHNGDFVNYGFAVASGEGSFARSFHSKEYWGNPPILVINYRLPEPSNTPMPEPTNTPAPTATNTPLPTKRPSPTVTPANDITDTPAPTATPTETAEETATSSAGKTSGLLIGLGLIFGLGLLITGGYFLYSQRKNRKNL